MGWFYRFFGFEGEAVMPNSRSARFATGVLFGAAIGTVTGLLLAPRTGRESRRLIQKSAEALPELAEDLSTSVQIQSERLAAVSGRGWGRLQLHFQDAIAIGVEAAKHQKQVLQARQIEDQ